MFRKILVTVGVVGILGPAVGAQQPQSESQATSPAKTQPATPVIVDPSIKDRASLFESAIQRAIEKAAWRLGEWADKIVGNGAQIYLQPAAQPRVSTVLLPDDSLAFDVQIAEMGVKAFNLYVQQTFPKGTARPTEAKQGEVRANSIPDPDPASVRPTVDPNQQYSDFVREELIKAMVDQGSILHIGPGQSLTVQVTPVDVLVQNVIYKNTSRKLSLHIKGDDLEAYRQKRITREELQLRVVDRRF